MHRPVDVDELLRDVPPMKSSEGFAAPEAFETDEGLEEFLAFVHANRNGILV